MKPAKRKASFRVKIDDELNGIEKTAIVFTLTVYIQELEALMKTKRDKTIAALAIRIGGDCERLRKLGVDIPEISFVIRK